jgi:hypothetical protein
MAVSAAESLRRKAEPIIVDDQLNNITKLQTLPAQKKVESCKYYSTFVE